MSKALVQGHEELLGSYVLLSQPRPRNLVLRAYKTPVAQDSVCEDV